MREAQKTACLLHQALTDRERVAAGIDHPTVRAGREEDRDDQHQNEQPTALSITLVISRATETATTPALLGAEDEFMEALALAANRADPVVSGARPMDAAM